MAKYLGIPLTVSNGNRIPLTAQPNKVENPTFEGTQTPSGVNFVLSSGWRLNNSGAGAAASSSEFTSEGAKIEWPAANPPSSTYLRAWNVSSASNLIVFTKGKAYKMTYTISSSNNDSGLRLENGASIVSLNTSVGTHEINFIADIDIFTIIRNNNVNSGATIVVSSVYVKEIAATETPTYGSPELVENSEFNKGNVDWTFLGTNPPSINNTTDTLDFTNSPTTAAAKTTNTILEQGKRYVATIDIESITSGGLALVYSAGAYSPTFTSAGVYNYDFVQDGSLNLASLECYSRDASTTAVVNSIKVKEVPYVIGTREFVKNGDFKNGTTGWAPYTNASLSVQNNKLVIVPTVASTSRATQGFDTEIGKTYSITASFENPNSSTVLIGLSPNENGSSPTADQSTDSSGTINVFYTATSSTTYASLSRNANDTNPIYYSDVSVVEIGYNYLQVADGGFKKSVKEGDVIFNTSTNTEGAVKQVIDNNVLLMSNNNFSTAGEFFNVFAANGDTRGNQVVRTDKYIMSEYDENPSNPQESSFWYAGGVDADKVTLTHLVPATNTFFVANLIEDYTQRLNAQSATASRLDIPLDAFRDHKNSEVLVTTSITLS